MKPEETETLHNAVMLPRDSVRPAPDQPRRWFDAADLASLAASIREHGLLQPLVVRYAPSGTSNAKFVVVAGERRWRASEGVLERLPCIVADVSAGEAQVLALTENIQRRDLTALEEAQAVAAMMTAQQLSPHGVARKLGMSRGWINNRLALLKTGDDVQAVAARQPLAMSSLLLIDSVTDDADERADLLRAVESGAPHTAIKTRIEQLASLKRLERAARRAPDAETQQRSTLNRQNGGGNVSRGRIIVGSNRHQARAVVADTVSEIERHLKTLSAWRQYVTPDEFARAVGRLKSQIDGLRDGE